MTSKKPLSPSVAITTKSGEKAWCGRNSPAHQEAEKAGRVGHPKAKGGRIEVPADQLDEAGQPKPLVG